MPPQLLLEAEDLLLRFFVGVFLGSYLFGGRQLVGLRLSCTYRYLHDLCLAYLTVLISEREGLAIYLLHIIRAACVHIQEWITVLIALPRASSSLHARESVDARITLCQGAVPFTVYCVSAKLEKLVDPTVNICQFNRLSRHY